MCLKKLTLSHLCQVDGLLCVLFHREPLHQLIEMEHGACLEVLDQRGKKVVDLLAAVLHLSRLPDRVHVGRAQLALHREKVEDDVGLLDHFHVEVWPKDVLDKTRVKNPLSQLQSGLFHLTH